MNAHSQQFITKLLVMIAMFVFLGSSQAASAKVLAVGSTRLNSPVDAGQGSAAVDTGGGNVDLLGSLGGAAQTIQIAGKTAYAGFGPEFALLDISDPANIQRLGWLVAAGNVIDISINGDLAYIAYRGEYSGDFGPTGLQVIDIRNPSSPTVLATREYAPCGSAPQVAADGSSVYFSYTICSAFGGIIQNAGAEILRLEFTTAGQIIDHASLVLTPGVAEGVAVQANVVYWLYSNIFGTLLQTFDVSSPGALVETGSHPVANGSQDIALANSYAFLAAGTDGLQVVDISDPGSPTPVITHTLPGEALVISIDGTTAYLGTSDAKILLVDISDPLNPVDTGTYTTTGSSRDIFIAGTSGYTANGWAGIEIFGTTSLSQLGVLKMLQGIHDIAELEPYAFTAADEGFWVLDVSDPTAPLPVAHLATTQPAVSIVLKDSYAFTACAGDGIHVIDVSNPLAPSEAGFYSLSADYQQLFLLDNTLYVAMGSAGLSILDISNPLLPQEIGSFLPSYDVVAVAVVATNAFLAAGDGNLVSVDVSNPAAAHEIGVYDPPNQTSGQTGTAVAVLDGIAYLGTVEPPPTPLAGFSTGDVWLVDVSDAENLALVSSIPHGYGWAPFSISLAAGQAYVVYQRQGLVIYDTSNLAALQEIGAYDPAENTYGATLGSETIYLFSSNTYILRYTDPSLPTIQGWVTQANHLPYPGVLVSAGSALLKTGTDAQGAYSIRGLADGSYTLTPNLPGYVFSPPSRTISVPPSAFSQNFTILPQPVEIDFTPGISSTLIYTDTQGLPTWIQIPEDASGTPLTLQIVPTVGEGATGYAFTGRAFELNTTASGEHSEGFIFNNPLGVTIRYSPQDIAMVSDIGSLALWWWNGSIWQDAAQSCTPASTYSRDPDHRTLSLPVCQTGVFKLMGPTNQIYLPRIFFSS